MFSTLKHYQHLNLIFNSIQDMVFLIEVQKDGTFRYKNVNNAAIKQSNLPKDLIGKTIHEVMPTTSADIITENYQNAVQSKKEVSYEAEIFIHDEDPSQFKKRYFESRVTPVFNDQDQCEYLISITHDVTERKEHEQKLRLEKAKLDIIFNHAADAVFTFDSKGGYVTVNPGFTRLLGWEEEELLNDPSLSIIPDEYKDDFNNIVEKLTNGEVIENHLSKRLTKEGNTIDVISSYTPIMENGKFLGGVAMYKDISELKRMTEQLRDSELRYRQIADHVSDLVTVIDKNGTTLYASPSHQDILGLPPDFYLDKSILTFSHGDDMNNIQHFMDSIIQTKQSQSVEFRRITKDRETIWIEAKGTPVLDISGNVDRIIMISRDIGKLKQREEAFKHQALHDHLTNLPNRRMFDNALDTEMEKVKRSKKPLAVFALDCDHFKDINDNYGHEVGDEVLKEFANRIKHNVSERSIVSRIGGDEFLILQPDIRKKEDATSTAKSILSSMNTPFQIGHLTILVGTSIGISFYYGDEISEENLLKQADDALYEAKQRGRDRFRVYAERKQYSLWQRIKHFFRLRGR
ncbi:sensor domain-containing protein [Pontibacillus marinus]|uniref:Diguanylate cyclase n=1 Tax=Pontibacillus marinus BH030004 = DSM 16465 TaxID=1385511 RepID=A0A0A5GIN6_9BACI|nr:sensor domain-containing diguanylate cyclase [Pontibacillus marinus]KGX91884.1 hypothetical protein N783_00630 [Pontibacillus marinus BH030004 = DSM 16465]